MTNKRYALSWSGGKDCMMALHKMKEQHTVACLLTTVPVETGRTFGHDEKMELIEAQSKALGIPVHFIHCRYDHYTEDFLQDLLQVKQTFSLDGIAYGDIYTEAHFDWGKEMAANAGLHAFHPLRAEPGQAAAMLDEFICTGYRATVIRTRKNRLPRSYLGRELTASFAADIAQTGCCPMGENGEYHTFVHDGPLFNEPIVFQTGDTAESDTSCRLELTL